MGRVRKLTVGLLVALVIVALAAPARALECEGIDLDDGCLFTITGGDTPDLNDGYAVTNADGVPLWDFVRDREAQAIGFPISQRWTEGPFTLQAFQKVILQWDPIKQRMNYYNTLDALANRYPWVELPFVPSHQVLAEDAGATFGTIIRNHLALLDENEAIKERFLSEPDWLNLYGLPIRYEEREVDGNPAGVQLLRSQRTVFVVWNVPAPGITVRRVNLQNVPDKLKKLSNVVIPDSAKGLLLAPDPALNPSIAALPWVADGISGAETETVLLLRKLLSSSKELFGWLLHDPQVAWLQRPPDPITEGALGILLAMADISWTRKHIGPAQPGILGMLVHAPRDRWPEPFKKLLIKPWMRDGVTWSELKLADVVLTYLLTVPKQPGHYFGRHDVINEIFDTMLDMPFLDTYEGFELYILRALPSSAGFRNVRTGETGSAGGPEYTLQALQAFRESGGISDGQALVYLLDRPSPLDVAPEHLVSNLHIKSQNLQIDERVIFQARSGHVRFYVVRHPLQPIAHDTIDTLHSLLNSVVEFTGVPFPNDHLIVRIQPFDSYRQGRHGFYYTWIAARYFNGNPIPGDIQRVLVHLLAYYYWENNTRWISKGAPTVYEYGLGYRSPDWPPEVGAPDQSTHPRVSHACPVGSIAAIDSEAGYASSCQNHLGRHMFVDLYQSLDNESFRNGFANLVNTLYSSLSFYCFDREKILDIPCRRPDRPSAVDVVTEAFTSGASPEGAAIARAVIGRWYYGDPGALTSP